MRTANILVVSAGLLVWTLLAPRAEASEPAGFVASVRGDARVVRDGRGLEARIGLGVRTGDRLVTGEKARLKILLTDDAVLALGAESEIVVTSHLFHPRAAEQGERHTRIELVGGSLRSLVQKLVGDQQADFEVKSANAVAGVRGTEFVLVAEEQRTRLVTFSGQVELAGRGGERVLVAAGEGSRVVDGAADAPTTVAAAELRRLRQATDTQQKPTALAWNLGVDDTDRLGGAGRVGSPGSGEGRLDHEPGEEREREGPDGGLDPDIMACGNCEDLGSPPSEADGRFTSGDLENVGASDETDVKPGNWMGDGLNADPASMVPVTLRIHLHR